MFALRKEEEEEEARGRRVHDPSCRQNDTTLPYLHYVLSPYQKVVKNSFYVIDVIKITFYIMHLQKTVFILKIFISTKQKDKK